MSENHALKSHIYLSIVAFIYGANYTIARTILVPHLIEPNGFILLRIGSGLFLFTVFYGSLIKVDKKDLLELIFLSITGVLINQIFFFHGLSRTSPTHASLIMLTTPLLVLLLTSIGNRVIFTLTHWIGTIIGFAGAIYLVLSISNLSDHLASIEGDIMIFINALSYAVYLSRVPRLLDKYDAVEILKWIFAIAFVFCLPFGICNVLEIEWNDFEIKHFMSMGFVLVCTTFIAYLLNIKALKLSNPSLVGNYIYLQPLIAIVIACSLREDQLTIQTLIAGSLIFLGIFLSTSYKPNKQ